MFSILTNTGDSLQGIAFLETEQKIPISDLDTLEQILPSLAIFDGGITNILGHYFIFRFSVYRIIFQKVI